MKLRGEITYNNTPIADGQIQFFPDSGKGPSAGAIIADGHYSVNIKPGAKKVKILGYKVVGTQTGSMVNSKGKLVQVTTDIKEQVLPPKFNDQTKLTCEIGPGTSTQNFNLTDSK